MDKQTRFLQLLKENKGILFKICKIYQEDPDDRNDLLQEMTLQLWLAFDSYRGESKFSSWMYRVALNTAIVFLKSKSVVQTINPYQLDLIIWMIQRLQEIKKRN